MDIDYLRFLAAASAVWLLGATSFSCDGVLEPVVSVADDDSGLDADTDADTDADADADTGTEDPEPVPDECWVQDYIFAELRLYGVCLVPGSECSGGYLENAMEGTCTDGLHCCIGDDECETWEDAEEWGTYCIEPEDVEDCPTEWGFFVGCPGDQVCCISGS